MTRVSKSAGAQYFLLHPGKAGTMQLPVPIDENHAHSIERKMAEATSERLGLEAKKKDQLAPINKRLAELRQTEKDLDAQRKSGQTMADVPVEERASFEDGTVWMVRKDTGTEVPNTRRAMTHAERQAFAKSGDGGLEPARPRRGEEPDDDDLEDDEPEDESSGLGSAMLDTATGSALDSIGALSSVTRDGRTDEDYRTAIRAAKSAPAETAAPSSDAPPATPAPNSGPAAAKASHLTLPPPLHAYSAYRFAPVGAITIYQDGRSIGTARFDVKKDDLVILAGQDVVPKKVVDAIRDACIYGELPIPGAPKPGQLAPEPDASSPPAGEGAPQGSDGGPAATSAAPLKLTANDTSALKLLQQTGAPLFPEKIGNLTRNRRPNVTITRLVDAGYVTRLEGGAIEITAAGRAAIPPPKTKGRGKSKSADAPAETNADAESAGGEESGGENTSDGGDADAIPFG
jgi:hypothetical protein